MTRNDGTHEHRHPDAVAYLEGLTEGEAAVHPPLVRAHDGGFTRYWIEGGAVRSRDIGRDELPLAGLRPDGGPLPALLAAVSAEFGPRLPRLAADLASGAPDLDGVERALRDSSLGGGAAALKLLLERLDGTLPAPECGGCGRPMARHLRASKSFLTRLGRVEVERSYFRCGSCGGGCFPLVAGAGRGGAALRAGGGAGRQAAGIAHVSLHRRDRPPDAERGDGGRRGQAG